MLHLRPSSPLFQAHDIIPQVDRQGGSTQYIPCDSNWDAKTGEFRTGTAMECHDVRKSTLLELLRSCGDPFYPKGRELACI